MKFLIGVDEAGRGPLAGPVAVGLVIAPDFLSIAENFPGVADSKALSEEKREALFTMLEKYHEYGVVKYVVEFASAKMIDEKGLSYAIRSCVYKGVRALAPDPEDHTILLDGLLKAPAEYAQKTIVGGDASEPIISLASIAAKVKRDRLMYRLAKQYPGYGFDEHKGYGTQKHLQAIKTLGFSPIHRKTFHVGRLKKSVV